MQLLLQALLQISLELFSLFALPRRLGIQHFDAPHHTPSVRSNRLNTFLMCHVLHPQAALFVPAISRCILWSRFLEPDISFWSCPCCSRRQNGFVSLPVCVLDPAPPAVGELSWPPIRCCGVFNLSAPPHNPGLLSPIVWFGRCATTALVLSEYCIDLTCCKHIFLYASTIATDAKSAAQVFRTYLAMSRTRLGRQLPTSTTSTLLSAIF